MIIKIKKESIKFLKKKKHITYSYSSYIGPKVLEFYESFFGVDYPIAKEDMAAVPDFWPGAMENWGLVTYQFVLIIKKFSNYLYHLNEIFV